MRGTPESRLRSGSAAEATFRTHWGRGMRARLKAIDAWVCGTAAATALGLAATGCAAGGPTPTSAAPPAPRAGTTPSAVGYSACVRAHGYPRFPDPAGSSAGVPEVPKGVDPSSARFKTAHRACRSLLPPGATTTNASDPHEQEALLALARCMRSHGVPAFPDPDPNGGTVQRMPPTVDTHSPAFATAQQKCRKLVPGLFGAQGAAAP